MAYPQVITVIIMTVLLIIAVLYRVHLLKSGKKKNSKALYWVGTPAAGLLLADILTGLDLSAEVENQLLCHALIIIGFVFLIISAIALHNTVIIKKEEFEETE